MKKKIYNILEKRSKINLAFNYFIITLIILNVLAVAIDTTSIKDPRLNIFLRTFEVFSIVIFSLEFSLRLYISDLTHPARNKIYSVFKFIFSPFGLVDLLAILPFYIPFLIKTDLRFLRILRLTRFFRIFKISRYNNTLKLIGSVIKDKKSELWMTLFVATLVLIVASFLMYFIEGTVQPDKFPDVFSSMWWAIVTLTTIGYGDVYPITALGKVLSGLLSIIGIGLIALPTGIISAGFIEVVGKRKSECEKRICPYCGKEIN
jgi:voltage-gated potassium channel